MRKTKKSAARRIGLTKSGNLKRSRSGKSHLMTGKNRKRKRNLRKSPLIATVDDNRIRRLLPHG